MPHPSRIYPPDEELGKKDDDRKTSRTSSLPLWRFATRTPTRWRKRRLLALVIGAFLLWLFIHNIPTDLGSIDQRVGRPLRPGHSLQGQHSFPETPTGPPPKPEGEPGEPDEATVKRYYGGPVKFYKLAQSLHGIAHTMGHRPANRNVLFATSSLRSVSTLVPMACEMAKWDRNYVHLVLMGREDIPLEELLEMNGIGKDMCNVCFHDARADYSEYSTDVRAEVAVAGAMNHINNFMHPQAIVMDDSASEDVFFVKGIRAKAQEQGHPIIEIPRGKSEDFVWMTRLDTESLSKWHEPSVDILVHAPRDSSGSLIRMLISLASADYTGLAHPRLTVELPSRVDLTTQIFLEHFTWPPRHDNSPLHTNKLILRHRISHSRASTEDSSIRFLESFYPANPADSHVLVLSPQVELSPLYFHHVHYHILEYKFSSSGKLVSDNLMGFSLDIPSAYLNGSLATPFVLPSISNMTTGKYRQSNQDTTAPFLWQAPTATAALYFGDKWAELHDFLSNRVSVTRSVTGRNTAAKREKLISETQPGWMEYVLELMRARGWSLLYPAVSTAGSLVTVHNELLQTPEEFAPCTKGEKNAAKGAGAPPAGEGEPFLTADDPPTWVPRDEKATLRHTQPLHALLPFDGALPEVGHLPLLSFSGDLLSSAESGALSSEYSTAFRKEAGGCDKWEARRRRKVFVGLTADLFCLDDGEYVEYEDEGLYQEDSEDNAGIKAGNMDESEDDSLEKGSAAEEDPASGKTRPSVDHVVPQDMKMSNEGLDTYGRTQGTPKSSSDEV
ncbi:hypothetical protein LTR50_005479 [Elasticomyces elasticus]|nr:hypothetical protein LTR50_005479 [Elasticomyces elasticus]